MAFTEDLSVFLADMGKSVTGPSSSSGLGILEKPGVNLGSDVQIMSIEYLLTIKSSDFPTLKYGDAMTVDGASYSVREAEPIDDGSFTKVLLTKAT